MLDHLSLLSGKRVFITGHTGFKGSWLTLLLQHLGAEVMGYALPPTDDNSLFSLLKLSSDIRHVEGDMRDDQLLASSLSSFQPQFVFHLAAQALVRPSYHDPTSTISTNVLGSANLLEAVRLNESVRSLVYITSDKCYENLEWVWGYRETDQLGGRDPYSASKAAAEIIFSSYQRSFFASRPTLGAASARAGNVIGGGDWAVDRIVPDCIRAIQAGIPVRLRNPKATRPWQHVLEPIAGYLLLAAKLYNHPSTYNGAWNLGPSVKDVRTVYDVAQVITSLLGRGTIEVAQTDCNVHEAHFLQLNCDKAHQSLGWSPRWNADKTLEATALWYKAFLDGANPRSVTISQIRDFFPELP
jgi:CDP-glucose 4,6-dehydratase